MSNKNIWDLEREGKVELTSEDTVHGCNVYEIEIRNFQPSDSEDLLRAVRECISESTTLESITFACKRNLVSGSLLSNIFDPQRQYRCPLNFITFESGIVGKHLQSIVPFLVARQNTLLSLDFGGKVLSKEGVGLITKAMNTGARIGTLNIKGSPICDMTISKLLSSKKSHCLLELGLDGGRISSRGVDSFAKFFARENTSMEKLTICGPMIDIYQLLLSSIPVNSTLRRLSLGMNIVDNPHQRGLSRDSIKRITQILERLICNQSDFSSLCQSNHRLHFVNERIISSSVVRSANYTNRWGDSANVKIRSKIKLIYLQGDFDMEPFLNIDVALMPNFLGLVTKPRMNSFSREEFGRLYRLVRNNWNLPELFSFPRPRQSELQKLLMTKNAQLETDDATSTVKETNAMPKEENELEQFQSDNSSLPNKRLKSSDL